MDDYGDEEDDYLTPPAKLEPVERTTTAARRTTTAVKRAGTGKVAMMGSPDNTLAAADPLSLEVLEVSAGLQSLLVASVEEYKSLGTNVPKYGGSPIYPFQYAIANIFARSTRVSTLFMEKGVGKTIMAFEAAKQITAKKGLCLIAVPTQTRATWWGQGVEAGLIDLKDPKNSKFLLFEPEQKEHFAYLTDPGNTAELKKRANTTGLVIIAKDLSVVDKSKIGGAMGILSSVGADLPLSIIVDEGHTPKRQVDLVRLGFADEDSKTLHGLEIVRVLYMSGSKITKIKPNHTMVCYLIARAPVAKWHILVLPKEGTLPERNRILRNIFRDSRHVIVSSGDGEWADIKELIPNKVTARSNLGRDDYFIVGPGRQGKEALFANDESKTAYHLTPVQGKGMNLLGDALVINSVDHFIIDSLIQLSYRPLRPNNPYDTVNVYVFVRDLEEYYKAYYASAFSYNKWTQGYDYQANPQFVAKSLVLPRVMGYYPDELGTVDRCTIMANYIGMQVSSPGDLETDGPLDRIKRYMTQWRAKHLAELREETIFEGDWAESVNQYYQ